MFTNENTDGSFSVSELLVLNSALQIRMDRGEEQSNASDAITNAWFDSATITDLVQ